MASPVIIAPFGSGTGVQSFSTTMVLANAGSAVQAGDILYLGVATDSTTDVSSIAGSNFGAFTRRGGGTFSVGVFVYMSTWWAPIIASATGFSVTATWGFSFDDAVGCWCIVRGCNPSAPFDANGSIPAIDTGAPPSALTFSTTSADDLLLYLFSGDNAMWIEPPPQAVTPSPPWTWIVGAGNTGGFAAATMGLYANTVSSPQSGASVGPNFSFSDGAVFLVDALVGAPTTPGVPIDQACGPDTTTSITLQWAAGSGAAPTSYTVQYRAIGTSMWTTIAGIVATSVEITGLMPGTTYEWQVEALNAGGNSGFTASFTCSTASIAPPPVIPQSLGRWRGLVGINWLGLALVGDAFSGVIGRSDFDNYTEYGNVMRMLITSPPLRGAERHRMFVTRVEVDVQAGSGFANTPVGAPVMMLDYSKNGGMTFLGLQKWRTTGQVGKYRTRLRWLNLGQSRAWVFRLQCTDNTRRQIIGIYLDAYEGLG